MFSYRLLRTCLVALPLIDVLSALTLLFGGVTLDVCDLSAVLLAVGVTFIFPAMSLVTAGGGDNYEPSCGDSPNKAFSISRNAC